MKRQSFSFAGDSEHFILRSVTSLLPGIEKIVAVYYSAEQRNLLAFSNNLMNEEYMFGVIDIVNTMPALERIRSDNAAYTWLRTDDIPFEISSKEKIQLILNNEFDNRVLLIRIPNVFDQKNDLYYFYFNQHLNNFGDIDDKKNLSAGNKTVIGNLLRNTIKMQLRILDEDREIYQGLNENIQVEQQELKTMREKYRDGLIDFCNNHLGDISQNTGKAFILDSGAIDKIREYKGDISGLRLMMERAATLAQSYNPKFIHNGYRISEGHIRFDNLEVKHLKVPVETGKVVNGQVPVVYQRTYELLDRLEIAAQKVQAKNMVLTSANICMELPMKISPPAISDALKNHQNKIISLHKLFPDRWKIIIGGFRPVQNAIMNLKSKDKKKDNDEDSPA